MSYNWKEISDRAKKKAPWASLADMARDLGIPRKTISDAYHRGDIPSDFLIPVIEETERGKLLFDEDGNEATLKFSSGERLTLDEALSIAGVNREDWHVVDYNVNMWQMGRKDVKREMTIVEGRVDGSFSDSGGINKEYLYQIKISLTRKKRIAVKPVLKPIEISFKNVEHDTLKSRATTEESRILFICDPHFGLIKNVGSYHSIHNRRFIGSLLEISRMEMPDHVIWSGDILDLPDLSTFNSAPAHLNSIQLAAIELGWVLNEFGKTARSQSILEGNHDKRLESAMIKQMAGAYQLKPIHELKKDPLMSISRLLGLDRIGVEWFGGYPSNKITIGAAKFTHGNVARTGSGYTAASLAKGAVVSHFYGHIHRYELVQKYVPDLDLNIYVGSPGCACNRGMAPGSSENSNWQLGAFLIHANDDEVKLVEHISGLPNGDVRHRDFSVPASGDYYDTFLESLPQEWGDEFGAP